MRVFQVIDQHTGGVVAKRKTRSSAIKLCDRKDNEYGAYRYSIHAVELCDDCEGYMGPGDSLSPSESQLCQACSDLHYAVVFTINEGY